MAKITAPPPAASPASPPPSPPASARSPLVALLAKNGVAKAAWYVLLDAAQDPLLPRRAQWAGLRVQSLYAGRLGAMLDDVAPHLAALDPFDGPFTHALLATWAKHLALPLQATVDFDELRRHFRKFLMVKDAAGKRYRFRYYDPRVLPPFLAASTAAEATEFFGPVKAFYLPGDDPDSAIGVRLSRGRATKRVISSRPAAEDSE